MSKSCPSCGGNLEQRGIGYKCRCCGKTFDNESEIQPKVKQVKHEKEVYTTQLSNDCGVDVFAENINGVLEITWSNEKGCYSGSGFLITNDGYAITNTHVVTEESGKSCKTVNVKLCNENIIAYVVRLGDDKHGRGNGVDLALIKLSRVPQNAKALRLENFVNVRIGEQVFVIGNSLGHGTCITSGIVSDKTRNVNGKMLLMTDCAVNGGNSGGPIFNEKGLIIGAVVSSIRSAEGMNFAIPSNVVQRFINFAPEVRIMPRVPVCRESENPQAASCSECPQCGGTNVQLTEGGFYWCGDCDCEW